jgi:hypothetical protein
MAKCCVHDLSPSNMKKSVVLGLPDIVANSASCIGNQYGVGQPTFFTHSAFHLSKNTMPVMETGLRVRFGGRGVAVGLFCTGQGQRRQTHPALLFGPGA